jgi:hypothetical protein
LFPVIPEKFKIGICEMKIFRSEIGVCLGTLVQDGLTHICDKLWRAIPAKFKTDI